MKRTTPHRILALLFTFSLLFGCFPLFASAENDSPTAVIGQTSYASLSGALNAAADGDTITLLRDVDWQDEPTYTVSKNVTIAGANASVSWHADARGPLFNVNASGSFSHNAVGQSRVSLCNGAINALALDGLLIEGNTLLADLHGTRFVIGGGFTLRNNTFAALGDDLAVMVGAPPQDGQRALITGNTFVLDAGSYGIRLPGPSVASWYTAGDASLLQIHQNVSEGVGVYDVRNNVGWTGAVCADGNYFNGGPVRARRGNGGCLSQPRHARSARRRPARFFLCGARQRLHAAAAHAQRLYLRRLAFGREIVPKPG